MGDLHSMSTDAGAIHREHLVQIGLMQALAAAVARGENIAPTLSQLSEYSRVHFLSEELLMQLYDYPDYDTHVQDHERMIAWLDQLEARKGEPAAMAHAVQELSAIFMRHIGSCDTTLHDFLLRLPQ